MLHVGLTGNIASGKSQAASLFAELGAHIIDADLIVRELLSRGTATYARILNVFGEQVLSLDGEIDRKRLARIIFFDPEKRRLLNELTHLDVGAEILRRIFALERSLSRGIVIVEAALIIESGSSEMFHRLVVVICDPGLQISRLRNRDRLSEEEARARIESQMPIKEKIKLADYTIDTSGTLKQTHDQVEAIYRDLLIQELRMREREAH
jgi:dephospho-CoA kinase